MRSSYENQSNLRHVVFMVIAMIAFAIEDVIIKQLAFKLPISQVLISVGLSGLSVLYGLSILKKSLLRTDVLLTKFLLRMLCELVASVFCNHSGLCLTHCFLSFVANCPDYDDDWGVFFKEPVNFKQWVLVLVGLFGTLLVIQPGTEIFNPLSLFALAGAVF